MQRLTKYIDRVLTTFLMFLMAFMVIVVSWQVVTRFVLQTPSSFTEELARFLLIWIGLLGAAYALRTKAHLGIDILSTRLTGFRKQVIDITVHTIIILFSTLIMIIGGLRLVVLTINLNQISAAMGVKMGYIYLVIPISGLLMVYYSILCIIESINGNTQIISEDGGQ